MWRADNSIKTLHISNLKRDLHNINARIKFDKKNIDIYSSYRPETKNTDVGCQSIDEIRK